MKLFKNGGFLSKIFYIELILVVSLLSSYAVTAYVKDAPLRPLDTHRPYRYVFDNYRVLHDFLGLPAEIFEDDSDEPAVSPDTTPPAHTLSADLLTLRTVETLLKEKKYRRADQLLNSITDPHPFLEKKKMKWGLQTRYLQQGYREFLEQYDTLPVTDNLQIQLLRINSLLKTGREETAFALFKELFFRRPLKPFQNTLPRRTLDKFLRKLSYDDWFRKFRFLARTNAFSEFLREKKYIGAPQLLNLFYGEFYYKRKRYTAVQQRLASVKSPKLLNLKNRLLLKIEVRRKNYDKLDEKLDALKADKPLHGEVLFDVASLLLIHRELDRSAAVLLTYIHLMESEPSLRQGNSNYWKALWLSAWIHYRQDRESEALHFFKKGTASPFNSYRMASLYWTNRLSRGQDGKNSSLKEYPFSYYYTKNLHPAGPSRQVGLKKFITLVNGKQGPFFQQVVEDLRSLLENGLIDESFEFVRWGKDAAQLSAPEQNVLKLIESILYLRKGDFYHAFITFRRNFDDYETLRLPLFLGAIYTPVKYRRWVEQYSQQHRLDPNFVFALIRQESFFRPDIVSPARANGLMQLLYSTARQTAARSGMRIRRWDLYTPQINIRLGTEHLKGLLDKYDGKAHLALAAYNAGAHRVDGWLKSFGNVPDDEFIELIPFSETRGYVKNILRNYYYYRFYYGSQTNQPGLVTADLENREVYVNEK